MFILFLNVASHDGLIALIDDDRVSASRAIDHRIDDAGLVAEIEGVLADAKKAYADVSRIACVIGPGGFTSLRVGVAAANALAYALKIPVAAVHVSDLYAARIFGVDETPSSSTGSLQVGASVRREGLLWLHSTKKSQLFLRGFGVLADRFPEPQLISVDDLRSIVASDQEWMGELIPEHRMIVDQAGLKEAALMPVVDVLPTFLSGQDYGKKTLVPWYGREG